MNTRSSSGTKWGLAAALGAAVAASACCTIPLLFVALGAGGAWIGTITALEPFRPFFITVAIGALAFAGYREWRVSREPNCDCEVEVPIPLRRSLLILGALLVLGLALSPSLIQSAVPMGRATAAVASPPKTAVVTLEIRGMTCAGCTVSVRTALTRLKGVEDARVSYEPPQAVVAYDPAQVTPREMVAAIKEIGYNATVKEMS